MYFAELGKFSAISSNIFFSFTPTQVAWLLPLCTDGIAHASGLLVSRAWTDQGFISPPPNRSDHPREPGYRPEVGVPH